MKVNLLKEQRPENCFKNYKTYSKVYGFSILFSQIFTKKLIEEELSQESGYSLKRFPGFLGYIFLSSITLELTLSEF